MEHLSFCRDSDFPHIQQAHNITSTIAADVYRFAEEQFDRHDLLLLVWSSSGIELFVQPGLPLLSGKPVRTKLRSLSSV
jgi:hypothetical protein